MKKTLLMLLLVLFTVGLIISCDGEAVENLFKDKIQQYTVTFNTNGGSEVPNQEVLSGNKVNEPVDDPIKDGYTFNGWYKEDTYTTEWNFGTDTVTEDTTLYAKWTFTPSTIKHILATVEEFPEGEIEGSTSTAPTNAWTNETFVKTAFTYKDIALILKNNDDYMSAELTTGVTFDETNNCYTATVSTLGTLKFYMTDDDVLTSFTYTHNEDEPEDYDGTYKAGGCLAAGTIITMADGTKQAVETLLLGDMIKTFDHETGEISSAPIYSMWAIENCFGNFTLHFADNISVSVVQEHCFFDRDTNRYEVITYQNASEYIGHHFYNADAGKWEELINVDYSDKPVTAYYIFTAKHFNHIAEGMLSLDPLDDASFTYVFDFGENLKFDEDKKLADIQKYGLMTMEEMPFVSKDYFEALNMQYLKIAYGKGLAEKEKIEKMIHYFMSL